MQNSFDMQTLIFLALAVFRLKGHIAGTITLAFRPDIPAGLDREAMESAVHTAINIDPTHGEVRA